jgi:hypothetical protein
MMKNVTINNRPPRAAAIVATTNLSSNNSSSTNKQLKKKKNMVSSNNNKDTRTPGRNYPLSEKMTVIVEGEQVPKRLKGFDGKPRPLSPPPLTSSSSSNGNVNSNSSLVVTPSFRENNNKSNTSTKNKNGHTTNKRKPFTRPSGKMIADNEATITAMTLRLMDYDADEEDVKFVKSLSSSSNLTLEDLERVITALERAARTFDAMKKMNQTQQDWKERNTHTITQVEYILKQVEKKQSTIITSFSKLEAESNLAGTNAVKKLKTSTSSSNNSNNNTTTTTATTPNSSLIINTLSDKNINMNTAQKIFNYWTEKRKRNDGPLLFIADPLQNNNEEETRLVNLVQGSNTEQIISALNTIREFREHLERVRLIADSARKREKIKKELLKVNMLLLVDDE